MLAVLIGYGPNDVKIPILVFESIDQARKHCNKLFGIESPNDTWDLNLEVKSPYAHIKEEKGPPFKIEELFKSYYGGCGECYRARIQEVNPGEAFGTWNLD